MMQNIFLKIWRSLGIIILIIGLNNTVLFALEEVSNSEIINTWNTFEVAIRDQKIDKDSAKKQFDILYPQLKQFSIKFLWTVRGKWIFPVKNYTREYVGTGDFKPGIYYGGSKIKGYDFYDGNIHGGHPAYDIFILDKNLDTLDDSANKEVEIIAPVDLVILSVYSGWEAGSSLRGGNYIWAFDLVGDRIFYFAHLKTIFVKPGEFFKAGQCIATMGRTGKNAYPPSSPTHLHLMVLRIDGHNLIPYDYLQDL